MKKPYQIESARAIKGLEEMAADGNPAIQMVLPMAEMVGWLHKGVGELVRQAGFQLMQLLMEEEVRQLVGERSQSLPGRTANRWGSERGYCVVMGQKVPVERPRVRSTEDHSRDSRWLQRWVLVAMGQRWSQASGREPRRTPP
jgi:putative transposase